MDFVEIAARGGDRMYWWELELLDQLVRKYKPKSIVEIGAWDGCSTITFGLAVKEIGGHVFSIDPAPSDILNSNIHELGLEDYITKLEQSSPWIDMDLIELPIDFLLIDGNHNTRWVLVDYHFFRKYVRKNGIIAIHDCEFTSVKKAIDIILETDKKLVTEVAYSGPKGKRGLLAWQI